MTYLLLTSRPSFARQAFERPVRILGEGGPEFSFVPLVERPLANPRRPSGDLAGGLITANELPHPLGAFQFPGAKILAAMHSKTAIGLETGDHLLSKIQRKRLNSKVRGEVGRPRPSS